MPQEHEALTLKRLLPDSGAVTTGGVILGSPPGFHAVEVLGLPERATRAVRGRQVGMIVQEPRASLNPVLVVGDQVVESIATCTALRGHAALAKAVQWLWDVGIPEPERRMNECPFRMSGARKRRVVVAMTLAAAPKLLGCKPVDQSPGRYLPAPVLHPQHELQCGHDLGVLPIPDD